MCSLYGYYTIHSFILLAVNIWVVPVCRCIRSAGVEVCILAFHPNIGRERHEGYPQLYVEFDVNLGYMRLCLE